MLRSLNRCSRIFIRQLPSSVLSTQPEPSESSTLVNINQTIKEVEVIQPQLRKYFHSQEHLREVQEKIPKSFFVVSKIRPSRVQFLLIDSIVAENVASLILSNLPKNENLQVCEFNPGLGLITEKLLDKGLKRIIVKEINPLLLDSINELIKKYTNRITVYDSIGEVTKKGFPLAYIRLISNSSTMCDHIYANLKNLETVSYVLIPARFFQTCIADNNLTKYAYTSVIFQLYFDYELLEKYSSKAFLPWRDDFCLIRLNLKKKLPVDPENFEFFLNFLKQCLKRRSLSLLTILEKEYKTSGLWLITHHSKICDKDEHKFSVHTKSQDLTPHQLLHIYLLIKNMKTPKELKDLCNIFKKTS